MPVPSFLPVIEYKINDYLLFKLNDATLYTFFTWMYYFVLEPNAAVGHRPLSSRHRRFLTLDTASVSSPIRTADLIRHFVRKPQPKRRVLRLELPGRLVARAVRRTQLFGSTRA